MLLLILLTALVWYCKIGNAQLIKNENNYGPYKFDMLSSELCRGPKSVNITYTSTSVVKEEGTIRGLFNMTFLNDTKIEEVRIIVYNVKENQRKVLWKYQLPKPCLHFVVGALVKMHLKGVNCLVKAGVYYFEINLSEMSKKFFGTSFFYGQYLVKEVTVSKKGNINCQCFLIAFTKKKVSD